jgi:hypothetical protein
MLITLLLSLSIQAKTIRVAIVDTGYSIVRTDYKQCDNGNLDRDFTQTSMNDSIGHGNNILHIITKDLEKVDYCIIELKVLNEAQSYVSLPYMNAMMHLLSLDVDIVNISMVGYNPNIIEEYAIKELLDKKVKVITAAGNEHLNLDTNCQAYPACVDKRIISVGCLQDNNEHCTFSNYGKYIKKWEKGMNVEAGGQIMSGTSQATARTTNKMIRTMSKSKKRK